MTFQPWSQDVEGSQHGRASAVDAEVSPRQGVYRQGGKRVLDVALVMIAALPVLPVIALLALCIRVGGVRPFYGHVRVGRDGRMFRCWKLRTMVEDGDAHLARHLAENPAAAREWAESRKLSRDPRITWFGRMLRRSSLDELPQLWNVLRGEMSLVGPRPVTAEEIGRYGLAREAYLQMRPGITGLWQVSGRNRLTYAERVALDMRYARECGLGLDLRIIAATVPAVLGMSGR